MHNVHECQGVLNTGPLRWTIPTPTHQYGLDLFELVDLLANDRSLPRRDWPAYVWAPSHACHGSWKRRTLLLARLGKLPEMAPPLTGEDITAA